MFNPTIVMCSHVWHYWRLFSYQVGALFRWPPQVDLELVICCTRDDPLAEACLEQYQHHESRPPTVQVSAHWMERDWLLRRANGRHAVCLTNRAERAIILTDADYLWGDGAIDFVASAFSQSLDLAYCQRIRKCSHDCGDRLITSADLLNLPTIPEKDFSIVARLHRAVGGCQIVQADLAREKGYLPEGHRFLRPASRWMRTVCDVSARKHIAGHRGVGIDVPNVLRIRHSKYGREHVGVEN